MHFAVPGILQRAGMLSRLFTDLDSRWGGISWLQRVPRGLAPEGLTHS